MHSKSPFSLQAWHRRSDKIGTIDEPFSGSEMEISKGDISRLYEKMKDIESFRKKIFKK